MKYRHPEEYYIPFAEELFGMQRESLRVVDVTNNYVTQPTSIITDISKVNATEIVTWSNRGYYLHDPINARDNDGSALTFVGSKTNKKKRKNSVILLEKDITTNTSKQTKKKTNQNETITVVDEPIIVDLNTKRKQRKQNRNKKKGRLQR
jgi:hypothetical protein